MNRRGVRPKGNVRIVWSSNFAYGIGLLATDGSVSSDRLHISFCSKDLEQVKNLIFCFGLTNIIGKNVAGHKKSYTFRVQFGDVQFWRFLVSIGIMPAKSKILGRVQIPDVFFFDFLRGCFDGDGSIHSYYDSRWKNSFMFYLSFASASKKHIIWLRREIMALTGSKGHITKSFNSSVFQLKYAKSEACLILGKMYSNKKEISLTRKKLKIARILAIVAKS